MSGESSSSNIKPNTYSESWFHFFHADVDELRTQREVAFICEAAPLPRFHNVLDVCCGMGRHADALSKRGYSVTAVDRDVDAVEKARQRDRHVTYIISDVREYQPESKTFDLAVVMGQSFGYFDPATNRDVLNRLGAGLKPSGRVILDLWNPEFFANHLGKRDLATDKGIVRETKRVHDGRLVVHLDYPGGVGEDFEWQLFAPEEMREFAHSVDLCVLAACSNFDQACPPSPANPRIQFILERQQY